MHQSLFSDLTLVLPYLADLDNRVNRCRELIRRLENARAIEVHVVYECDEDTVIIGQGDTPFNLSQEVKVLLEDTIDEYQRAIVHLNQLANEDGIC